MMVTLDRYDLAAKCVPITLERTGCPFELLCTDNGSTDRRVVDLMAGLNPVYHRLNQTNDGYASALNQMLLRATGEYLCIIDPDIEIKSTGWLAHLVQINQAIPESGISGYHCVLNLWDAKQVNGFTIHPGWHCFGVKFFNRAFLEKIGYYDEDLGGPYGNEDVVMNFRANRLGFMNYYVGGAHAAIHHGDDVSDTSAYRKMKWESLARTQPMCDAKFARMDAEHDYYVSPPPLKEPI